MATGVAYRGRQLRSSRLRRRRDSEDEAPVQLDWSKDRTLLLKEILANITDHHISSHVQLSYLNLFTKFCGKYQHVANEYFSLKNIFYCLRVPLFNDKPEVRAAALRAIRYLVKNEEAAKQLRDSCLDLLIVRSLDIALDNKIERVQCIRLIRQLISVDPLNVPQSLLRCLVSIANDGIGERDVMVRSSWATLAEASLLNPVALAEAGGLSAILGCVLQGNQSRSILEALLGCILYLLNDPEHRKLLREDVDLEHFLATFTDCYTLQNAVAKSNDPTVQTTEQKESRFATAKNALIILLRSWPGLIHLSRDTSCGSHCPSGIHSLVDALHMPYADIRRHVMELFFELLFLPIPAYLDSFDQAMASIANTAMQDSWQLYDGFVSSEGSTLLPPLSSNRKNLLDNYLALLLSSLISNGLINALIVVITKPKDLRNSVRATLLLGEVLHLVSMLLPPETSQQCHILSGLVNAATCDGSTASERDIAYAAINCLNRMHSLKKEPTKPASLYLEQLMQWYSPNYEKSTNPDCFKLKSSAAIRKEPDESTFAIMVRDTLVATNNPGDWDWDLISNVLCWPSSSLKRLEEPSHRNLIKGLINFFKPSSKQFSMMDNGEDRAKRIALSCCHLIDFLLEIDESRAQPFLSEFINDIVSSFSQITSTEHQQAEALFSPARMLRTLSHYYFLFVGRLSSSHKGKKLLEKSGLNQLLTTTITATSHETYSKLIISSFDCSQEDSYARTLIAKILNSSSDQSRLYATNFLRVLLRSGLSSFKSWVLQLLMEQLFDKTPAVTLAALQILDEACDQPQILEAMFAMRPSLVHLGDMGTLFLCRYASFPAGLKYLKDSNMLTEQFRFWESGFNCKYVLLVENMLNENLTYHRRSEDGTYGRRTDRRTPQRSLYLPVHLYGQLSQTVEGYQTLMEQHRPALNEMVNAIKNASYKPNDVIKLKAALWAMGHIGSSACGYRYINENNLILDIVNIAGTAPVLSVRGTAFYVLGLLSATDEAALELNECEWNAICRYSGEKWPLVRGSTAEYALIAAFKTKAHHSLSLSSAETSRFTDIYDQLTGAKRKSVGNIKPDFDADDGDAAETSSANGTFLSSLPAQTDLGQSVSSEITAQALAKAEATQLLGRQRSSSESQVTEVVATTAAHQLPINGKAAEESREELQSGFSARRNSKILQPPVSLLLANSFTEAARSKPPKMRSISQYHTIDLGQTHNFSSSILLHPAAAFAGYGGHSPLTNASGSLGSAFSCSTSGSAYHSYHTVPARPGQALSSGGHSNHATITSADSMLSLSLADAHGYATLRAIQRSRVHSLGFYQDNVDGDTAETSDQEESALVAHSRTINLSVSLNLASMSTSIYRQALEESMGGSDDTFIGYIGVCLPQRLELLFGQAPARTPTVSEEMAEFDSDAPMRTYTDRIPADQRAFNDGLELHSDTNCILCCSCKGVAFSEDSLVLSSLPRSVVTLKERAGDSDTVPSSIASTSSAEGGAQTNPLVDYSASASAATQISIRREVMRFVTNLSGSVAAKAAEQGLLSLKQRYPSGFQDICLYSEVILQMSKYNFRLTARRFIQELFMDIKFDELKAFAEQIVRREVRAAENDQGRASPGEVVEKL